MCRSRNFLVLAKFGVGTAENELRVSSNRVCVLRVTLRATLHVKTRKFFTRKCELRSLDGRVYALAAPPVSAFRPTEVPLEGLVPSDGQVVSSLEESRCAAFALLVCAHIIADY